MAVGGVTAVRTRTRARQLPRAHPPAGAPAGPKAKARSHSYEHGPVGMAEGFPWKPRPTGKAYQSHPLIVAAVEFFEEHPEVPNFWSGVQSIVSALFARDPDTPVRDVPDEPRAWKFGAVGDMGAGTAMQERVAANLRSSGSELILGLGDIAYPTGRWQDYAKNFDAPRYYGRLIREIPFMPVPGNHDMYRNDMRPYYAHFPHLKGQPYYSFVHKNAHFFGLDSNQDVSPGSPQYKWLEKELKSSTSKWRIVYLHYPLFSSGSHAGFVDIRNSLQPLFEKYKVHLVLSGHVHSYERTRSIRGVTYVISGGGGQIVYPFVDEQPAWIAKRAAVGHHVDVAVGNKQLVVRAVSELGRTIDVGVIPATGRTQAAQGAAEVARARRRQAEATAAGRPA